MFGLGRLGDLGLNGGLQSFSPASLTPDIWLDPSDIATLFQDDAHTTPVTANNDPVGAVFNKGTLGGYLTQSTANARPLYKTSAGLSWLEADGTNDFLSLSLSLNQPIDRVSALRIIATADNTFIIGAPNFRAGLYQSGGTLNLFSGSTLTGPTLPANGVDFVATESHNGASSSIAVDNAAATTGDAGADPNNGIVLADVGSGGQASNVRVYGVVEVNRLLTNPEKASLRTYLAAKQGRAL